MGYIDTVKQQLFSQPSLLEEDVQDNEEVNRINVQALLKDINREKQLGKLGVFPWSGQGVIKLGYWANPLGTGLVLCDDLTDEQQIEAKRLMDDMEVAFIYKGIVFYKRDDCPQHFRQYGTGDCSCDPDNC